MLKIIIIKSPTTNPYLIQPRCSWPRFAAFTATAFQAQSYHAEYSGWGDGPKGKLKTHGFFTMKNSDFKRNFGGDTMVCLKTVIPPKRVLVGKIRFYTIGFWRYPILRQTQAWGLITIPNKRNQRTRMQITRRERKKGLPESNVDVECGV